MHGTPRKHITFLDLVNAGGWTRRGVHAHRPCPFHADSKDAFFLTDSDRLLWGCRRCSDNGSGRIDWDTFKAHLEEIGFPVPESQRSAFVWKAVDGRTREQYRWDRPTGDKDVRWSKPTAGTPKPNELMYEERRAGATMSVVVEGANAARAAAKHLQTVNVFAIPTSSSVPTPESLARIPTGFIVCWPDRDTAGHKAMAQVIERLQPRPVMLVDPKNLKGLPITKGADAANWTPPADRNPIEVLRDALVEPSPLSRIERVVSIDEKEPALDALPMALGRGLLMIHGDRLMVVTDKGRGELRVLDPRSGAWHEDDPDLMIWLEDFARQRISYAGRVAATSNEEDGARALVAAESRRRSAARKFSRALREGIGPIREVILSAYKSARLEGKDVSEVTTCDIRELDQDGRYLACANGVIDLHTAKLLSASKGRSKKLTAQAPHEYHPWDEHPPGVRADIDRLFAHLEPSVVDYWWRCLAFAILGLNERVIYCGVGPPKAGKGSVLAALRNALGEELCSLPPASALEVSDRSAKGRPDPEMKFFVEPYRLALCDEAIRQLDIRFLNRASGGTLVTFRRLRENFDRSLRPTATIIMFCNEEAIPRFGLENEGMSDRFREIRYTAVPEDQRISGFRPRMQSDPAIGAAMLARLVLEASKLVSHEEAPEAPPLVRNWSRERASMEIGPVGDMASKFKAKPGGWVAVPDAWAAYTDMCGESANVEECEGVRRSGFARRLRAIRPDLGAPRRWRNQQGKPVQAWRGWELLDEAEAETVELETGTADSWETFSGEPWIRMRDEADGSYRWVLDPGFYLPIDDPDATAGILNMLQECEMQVQAEINRYPTRDALLRDRETLKPNEEWIVKYGREELNLGRRPDRTLNEDARRCVAIERAILLRGETISQTYQKLTGGRQRPRW